MAYMRLGELLVASGAITEEQLEQQVKQLRALAESTPDISFAVGTAHVSGGYDIRKAMQTADERMYKDKKEYYRLNPDKNRSGQNEE